MRERNKGSMKKAVVLTRPALANEEFAHFLGKTHPNMYILEMPLARFVATKREVPDLSSYDAAIVTSNAVFATNKIESLAHKWLVVGARAADSLHRLGANNVQVYLTSKDLLDAALRLDGENLIYLRGENVNLDLVDEFRKQGKSLSEVVLYGLEDIEPSAFVKERFEALDYALLPIFSQNSFARLLEKIGAWNWPARTEFLPFSRILQDFANEKLAQKFDKFKVLDAPERPQRHAMIARIDAIYEAI